MTLYLLPVFLEGFAHLPVKKKVSVLPNATRMINLVIVKEELVTGKFEVTRMTFSEIRDAEIDVYDPANRNLYSVSVVIQYEGGNLFSLFQ